MERLTITVDEAALKIGISRASLYNAINRGEFTQVIRIGRRILVPREALDKYLSLAGNGGTDNQTQM